MTVAWFDPERSRAAVASWWGWSEQLDIGGRTLRIELDAVALGDRVAGPAGLESAADRLRALGTFTDRIRHAVETGDRGVPVTSTEVAAAWADATRFAAMSEPLRESGADDTAMARWLRRLRPDDRRARLEAGPDTDPERVLAGLDGAIAVVYWEILTDAERSALAIARPDLVALRVLANGGSVSSEVARRLDRANAFGSFSQTFAAEIGIELSARLLAVEVGAGLTVVMTKMSDGSVEMTLVEHGELGAGVGLDLPTATSASFGVGVFGELKQRFRFPDEADAADAVHVLRAAVREDASFGEIARDVGGSIWNRMVMPSNAGAEVANWLIPFFDPVPTVPVYDLTTETARALEALWTDHGVSRQEGGGVFAEADVEFDAVAGVIKAELGAAAEVRMMFYDTDVAAADITGAVGRTGVVVAGAASFEASGPAPGPVGGGIDHVAAAAGYLLDLHHVDGAGTFLTVTVQASAAAGDAMQLVDLGVVDAEVIADRTAMATIGVTVPVTGSTADVVADVGAALARGQLPVEQLRQLSSAAEIDVVVTTGSRTDRELDVEAGAVRVEASVSTAETTTRAALRQYPGGELFSQLEVDRLVDAAIESA